MSAATSSGSLIDISKIIDERKLSKFNAVLLIVSFLLCLVDGYDAGAIGYAAPSLIKGLHITNRADFGVVFSAALFGILIGSPLCGVIGDYFGRKKITIIACLLCSLFTWWTVTTTSLDELIVLRFLTGIGLGGLLPNIIALNAEYAPKRIRAFLIVVMFTGTPLGAAVPGPIAAALLPIYGWTILFTVGGVGSLLIALAAVFLLPESLKYLSLKNSRRAEATKLLKQMDPGRVVPPGARLVITDEQQSPGISPKYLFQDRFTAITTLLWILYILNMMGYFFLLSWTPTLLTSVRVPLASAAIATSLFQLGGVVGSWGLSRPIDKKGILPMFLLLVVTGPIVGSIGYAAESSVDLLMAIVFLAGFCVVGLQISINVVAALVYPTSIRANGSGWAQGVGRVGSIAGPLIGGYLIAANLSVSEIYMWAAVPFVIGMVACFFLMRKLGGGSTTVAPSAGPGRPITVLDDKSSRFGNPETFPQQPTAPR